jgi:hypothetical protein
MMKIRWHRFNIYLAAAVALSLLCGCQTAEAKRKKLPATLRLYLEENPDRAKRTESVSVGGIKLNVQNEPFLNEAFIKKAEILEVAGGFSIRVTFDRHGKWVLEQYTTSNRGRHLVMLSQWVPANQEKVNKGRWIAAPFIGTAIDNGIVDFTPDATREEADIIVLGLNNVARKTHADETANW